MVKIKFFTMPQATAAGPYQVQSYSHFIPHAF
jgi:hypothetical protein